MKPDEKIALQDVFALNRDRHENTPYATDIVGNTRPIAIDRTGQAHFFQYQKGRVPVMWSCLTAPEFGVYLPVYANVSSIPEGLSAATAVYDESSFSWQLRLISDLAVTDRTQYAELVCGPFKRLENELIETVRKMPAPTDAEATQALTALDQTAWALMNEVKIALITAVSENTVLATNPLGRD